MAPSVSDPRSQSAPRGRKRETGPAWFPLLVIVLLFVVALAAALLMF